MKYIHTNDTSPAQIQQYLDDIADVGAVLYANGGYDTIYSPIGRPEVIGKKLGVSAPESQRTVAFDVAHPKAGTAGFYCRNIRDYHAGAEWVDQLPDYANYTGLMATDDISAWK